MIHDDNMIVMLFCNGEWTFTTYGDVQFLHRIFGSQRYRIVEFNVNGLWGCLSEEILNVMNRHISSFERRILQEINE